MKTQLQHSTGSGASAARRAARILPLEEEADDCGIIPKHLNGEGTPVHDLFGERPPRPVRVLRPSGPGRKETIIRPHGPALDLAHHAVSPARAPAPDKKKMEAALVRMQRLESLGTLAGGIMHDLNNCLTPALASVELLKYPQDEAERNRCLEIVTASIRQATGMITQVMDFARGCRGQSESAPLALVMSDIAKMMRDTFPKTIQIDVRLSAGELWNVPGPASEIYQVLLNLCVNSRDAMPKGGRLLLTAENAVLSASAVAPFRAAPGRYVHIRVTDTGAGIAPAVLPRIFEPFFTTKPASQGTGLGLSTVAAIIHHHGGFIDVRSEAGRGTEFTIHLPASKATNHHQSREN